MKFTIDSFKDVGRSIVKDAQKQSPRNDNQALIPRQLDLLDESRPSFQQRDTQKHGSSRGGGLKAALMMDSKELHSLTPKAQVLLTSPRVNQKLSRTISNPSRRLPPPWATPTISPRLSHETSPRSSHPPPKEFVADVSKTSGLPQQASSNDFGGEDIRGGLRRRISQIIEGGSTSLSQAGTNILSSLSSPRSTYATSDQPSHGLNTESCRPSLGVFVDSCRPSSDGLHVESPRPVVAASEESVPSNSRATRPRASVLEQLKKAVEKAKKQKHLLELAGQSDVVTQAAEENIVLPQFSDFDTPPQTPGEARVKSMLSLVNDDIEPQEIVVEDHAMPPVTPSVASSSSGLVSKEPSSRPSSSKSSSIDFGEEREALDGPFSMPSARRKSDVSAAASKVASLLLKRRKSESDVPEQSAPSKPCKPWTKLRDALEQLKPKGKQFTDCETFIFNGIGVLWDVEKPQWLDDDRKLEDIQKKCIAKVNGLISSGKRVLFVCNSPQHSQRTYLQELLRRGIQLCDSNDSEALQKAERSIISCGRTCACFLQACAVRKPFVFSSHLSLVEDLLKSGAFDDMVASSSAESVTIEAFAREPNQRNVREVMDACAGVDAVVVGWDRDPSNMKLLVTARLLAPDEDNADAALKIPFVACCAPEWKRKLKWLWNRSTCQSLTSGARVDPELDATDVRFPSGCLLCALATAEEYSGYGVDLAKAVYIGCEIDAVEFAAQGGMECMLIMNSVVTKMELKSLRAKGTPMPAWILPTFADES